MECLDFFTSLGSQRVRMPPTAIHSCLAARRALTKDEEQIAAANGPGMWGQCTDCDYPDCSYNDEDVHGDVYVVKCAGCSDHLCQNHLHACDMCRDYVCASCIEYFPVCVDNCPCFLCMPPTRKVTVLSITGTVPSYYEESTEIAMCPKHYRMCSEGCEEHKCLCHFRGNASVCRECE